MGKQAKKKDPKLKSGGRIHNPQTRGVNTSKQGALWAIRTERTKGEDGKPKLTKREVRVPINTGWNPSFIGSKAMEKHEKGLVPEPFDALYLSWEDEIRAMVEELNEIDGNKAWVERTPRADGSFTYSVHHEYKHHDKESGIDYFYEETIFSIDSTKNLNFGQKSGKFAKKVKD